MYHGKVSKWLMHEDQKELFEILFAFVLNLVFLALITLLLWPLGKPAPALRLAGGYAILWLVIVVTFLLHYRILKLFRVNLYDYSNAYRFSNLAVSCLLQAGWSAFAALTIESFVVSAPQWLVVILYLVGLLSCIVAYAAVSSFYQGHIYKLVSLPLTVMSFIVFSVWSGSGHVIYGWFFDLF